MKGRGGVEVQVYSFFKLGARWDHAPAALPPGRRYGTHFIGGWVSPKTGLDRCGKHHLSQELDPRTLQHLASRYTG